MFWTNESELEGNRVLALHGELDMLSQAHASDTLGYAVSLPPSRVICDLEKLEFLDCAGLRVLLRTRKHCESLGGWLILSSPRGAVARMLHALGMDEHFLIWEGED